MAGLFSSPKVPAPLPVPSPGDNANRLGDILSRRLQAGGSNADATSGNTLAPTAGPRAPTLTGLN